MLIGNPLLKIRECMRSNSRCILQPPTRTPRDRVLTLLVFIAATSCAAAPPRKIFLLPAMEERGVDTVCPPAVTDEQCAGDYANALRRVCSSTESGGSLILSPGYAGPILVCDIYDTLRDTCWADLALQR